MLHRGQQLSAATARNVLAITEWRLSARSAGSDDVLDDSQPSDRADQAATSRDGMSQLCMSLEGPPSWHVHHGNAHRLDTTCKYESPTTSLDICLASSRPLHTPPPPLPRTPCTHTQTAAHENDLKPPRGGPTGGGGRPPGLHPLPPPQTSPLNPSTLCLQARARDGRAGGGGLSRSPGAGQREWGLPIPAPGSRILHAFKGAAADYSGREPYPPAQPACPPFIGIKGPGAIW